MTTQQFERAIWGNKYNTHHEEVPVIFDLSIPREEVVRIVYAMREDRARRRTERKAEREAKIACRPVPTTSAIRRKRSPKLSFEHLLTLGDRHRAAALGVTL